MFLEQFYVLLENPTKEELAYAHIGISNNFISCLTYVQTGNYSNPNVIRIKLDQDNNSIDNESIEEYIKKHKSYMYHLEKAQTYRTMRIK